MVSDRSPTSPSPGSRRDLAARLFRPTGMVPGARPSRAMPGEEVSDPARRPRDVICAGMYRACSTWQYEVIGHLMERHFHGRRLGYLTGPQYAGLIRSGANDQTSAASPGWRVLKSHEGDASFARALAEGRALAVYAYRDIRDVVFSLMHKRGLAFERLLRQGMIHQILANDRFWTGQPNVLIQRYDDLLADPVGGVVALARHLGIAPSDGEAAAIAGAYSLESNKARSEALRRRLEQVGVDLNQAANSQICDATTLLHWNHVRSGGSGTWGDQATPAQRMVLHRLCRRWLQARDYPRLPAGADANPDLDGSDSFRIEADLMVGRLNYLARAASLRLPRLAQLVKRILRIPTDGQSGATVWSETKRDSPVDSSAR